MTVSGARARCLSGSMGQREKVEAVSARDVLP